MFLWSEVTVREREHAQAARDGAQAYLLKAAVQQSVVLDRWQWRMMNAIGGWLVAVGCRLQTHVETARKVVTSSSRTLESNPPCP